MNLFSSAIRVFHSIIPSSMYSFNKYLLSDNDELSTRDAEQGVKHTNLEFMDLILYQKSFKVLMSQNSLICV